MRTEKMASRTQHTGTLQRCQTKRARHAVKANGNGNQQANSSGGERSLQTRLSELKITELVG